MGKRKDNICIICICIIILLGITGIILGIVIGVKAQKNKKNKEKEKENNNPFVLTEKHKSRVSLLQQCMNIYGEVNIPELKDEDFNSTEVSSNKILSITKLELNGNKGETIQIFKSDESIELEVGEYSCISYQSNKTEHIVKVNNGSFLIPNDLDGEVNETEFTFILYINYDPEINQQEIKRNLNKENNGTSLALYDNNKSNNKKLMRRRLNFFSKIKDFFQQNVETIVEKAIGKLVSIGCVALIKYLCKDYNNIIIKSVGQFACDEIGEFIGEGVTKLIFNSDSKPAENYQEIAYEEAQKYNFSQLVSTEAEMLRNSIKGKNKNLNTLIKLITSWTNEERRRIKKSYDTFYGSDLIEDFKEELMGNFEDTVIALFYHPVDYDCYQLHYAMTGLGTYEDILIEIISNRPNNVLKQIKQRYTQIYPGNNLIDDVKGDTSGNFEDTLVALLEEKRATNTEPNYADCEYSANLLNQKADSKVYMKIFTEKSQADFVVIEDFYYNLADKTLLSTVEKEFSGDFKDGLIGIYYAMINPAEYFAKKVHDSIYGLGTIDNDLIRIMVTRFEIDMPLINEIYKKLYNVSMLKDIKDDTSGSYQTLLLTLASSGNYTISSSFLKTYTKKILLFILLFINFSR